MSDNQGKVVIIFGAIPTDQSIGITIEFISELSIISNFQIAERADWKFPFSAMHLNFDDAARMFQYAIESINKLRKELEFE